MRTQSVECSKLGKTRIIADASIRRVRNATFFEQNFHLHFQLKPTIQIGTGRGHLYIPYSVLDLDCGFVGAVEVRAAADEKPVLFCKPLDVLFLAGGVRCV